MSAVMRKPNSSDLEEIFQDIKETKDAESLE